MREKSSKNIMIFNALKFCEWKCFKFLIKWYLYYVKIETSFFFTILGVQKSNSILVSNNINWKNPIKWSETMAEWL